MNAPAAPIAAAIYELVPLTQLAPSCTHVQELRRKRFRKEAIAELAQNIGKIGIQQPIVARKHPRPDAFVTLEIVMGERRWLAAQAAGQAHVPVIVREIADGDVVELQLSENLQRENPHELEEAEGYDELRKIKKLTAEQIGERMGKSRSHVFARMKLLELCPEARDAFYAGTISASVAHLVARIGHHDTQRKALKDLIYGRPNWQGEHAKNPDPMSYREAQEWIADRYMVDLKGAPFKLEDAQLLPKAGPCTTCPKRAGNQRDLFHDVKNPNVCTDPKCFEDKRAAVHAGARLKLEAAGKKVIHGDAAKKLLPQWNSDFHDDHLAGGYEALDSTTYASGRGKPVRALLGPDYQPVLIQHPKTGELIEAATSQAIAAAATKNRKSDGKATRSTSPKPKEPSVEDLLPGRLMRALHEKCAGELGRRELLLILDMLMVRAENVCWTGDLVETIGELNGDKKMFDLTKNGLAKRVRDMDVKAIGRLAMECAYALALEDDLMAPIEEHFKLDRKAIRAAIEKERIEKKEPQKKAPAEAKKAKPAPAKKAGGKTAKKKSR